MYFNETTGSMRSVISFTNQKIHFNMTSLDSIVDTSHRTDHQWQW